MAPPSHTGPSYAILIVILDLQLACPPVRPRWDGARRPWASPRVSLGARPRLSRPADEPARLAPNPRISGAGRTGTPPARLRCAPRDGLIKPTVSLLRIPLVYCHINSFQRASSME